MGKKSFQGILKLGAKEQKTNIEKAVVAFSDFLSCVTILWATDGLKFDVTEAGIYSEDVFPNGEDDNPDHGIWVWEGKIIYHEEDDPEYIGLWRKPTAEEWLAIVDGNNPWKEK